MAFLKAFAFLLLVASKINAQSASPTTVTNGAPCSGDVSYCAGTDDPIILRCLDGQIEAGNCDDNLNEPPLGAVCVSYAASQASCSAIQAAASSTITLPSSPRSSAAATITTSNGNTAAATTSALMTTASSGMTAASTASPAGTGTSSEFSFSISNKNLPSAIASIVLPADVNVGCELCQASGSYALSIGGYTTSDDEAETVRNFLDNGHIDIDISQLVANLSVDIQLLSGFQPVSIYLVAATGAVSERISKSVTLTSKFAIGIPLVVTLDSPVTFDGGVTINVPGDINIHIVPSSLDASSVSGFNANSLSALPFKVNAPNLAFDIATGYQLQVELIIDAELTEHVSTSGSLGLTVDIPGLDAAFQVLSNVNNQCQTPASGDTVHQNALLVTPTGDFVVSPNGSIELALSLAEEATTTTLVATQFPSYSTSYAFPTQCLYDSSLKASFLNAGHSKYTGSISTNWLFIIFGVAAFVGMI